MHRMIEEPHIRGRLRFIHRARDGSLLYQRIYHNLICQGMDTLLAGLLNFESPTLGTFYVAIGAGATAPAYTDIQLQTETQRVALAVSQRTANQVSFTFEFPPTFSANATEAGVFANGTAAANSGTLLNHVAVSESVVLGTSLICVAQFTIQ